MYIQERLSRGFSYGGWRSRPERSIFNMAAGLLVTFRIAIGFTYPTLLLLSAFRFQSFRQGESTLRFGFSDPRRLDGKWSPYGFSWF